MTELFRAHPRTWREFRFCYPVVSRRSRGLSLGVNLNPDGACNFDCPYCSVDRTRPPAVTAVDEAALAAELSALLDLAASGAIWAEAPFDRAPPELRRLNDIAFSGDGEPTTYAGFARMLEMAGYELDRRGLDGVKVVVITNATLFGQARVREALVALARRPSEVWAKLDAGTEDWYRRVDRSEVPFDRILANLRDLGRMRPLVIQSMFCRLKGEAPAAAELDAWAARLSALRAGGVQLTRIQVYTTARVTTESWVQPLAPAELEAIAGRVRALGCAVEVHA